MPVFSVSGYAVLDVEVVERWMEGNQIIVTCTININFTSVKIIPLLEIGVTGYVLIDRNFAHHYNTMLQHLKALKTLEVIDGNK